MTALQFMALFQEFQAPSWDGWRTIIARLTGEIREFYALCGRGAGKSRIVALLAVCFAAREYACAPGERIYVGIFAPDRRQAGITYRYVLGLLQAVPALAALIEGQPRRDSVDLRTGVTIEVITARYAAPRGRSYALVIIEEAAFLPADDSAYPDVELVRAVEPGLARVLGSLLAIVSSVYARRGVPFQAWQRYHDQPDGDVVFVQAPTLELNPTFNRRAIEKAYEDDPIAAATEYGAQFRRDIEGFVAREAVEACVVAGRRELPRVVGVSYAAFLDFAGGSGGDSATCAIAHAEQRDDRIILILDAIREVRPPFSPEQTCAEFGALMKAYGVSTAKSDRWAGEFPVEQLAKHGIRVEASEKTKSDLYREVLPLLNSQRVELLDHPRLFAQLTNLERRTGRGGRDVIDHPPGGGHHDDVVNSTCGVLLLAAQRAKVPAWTRRHMAGFARAMADLRGPSPSLPSTGAEEWGDYVASQGNR